MGHVLLVVIDCHEEVSIARFKTFCVEELFDKLHILDISFFALVLFSQSVVKSCHEAIGLQDPSQFFVEKLFLLCGFGKLSILQPIEGVMTICFILLCKLIFDVSN